MIEKLWLKQKWNTSELYLSSHASSATKSKKRQFFFLDFGSLNFTKFLSVINFACKTSRRGFKEPEVAGIRSYAKIARVKLKWKIHDVLSAEGKSTKCEHHIVKWRLRNKITIFNCSQNIACMSYVLLHVTYVVYNIRNMLPPVAFIGKIM